MKYSVILLLIFTLFGCTNTIKYYRIPDDIKTSIHESDSSAVTKYKDSIRVVNIKPGYYHRKKTVEPNNQEAIFYNEINWVYVSNDYKTTFFITANYEGCNIKELDYSKSPKGIYRQLKQNPDIIKNIPLGWCREPELPPSMTIKESIIIIDTVIDDIQLENKLIIQEKLIFQKDGLIRLIANNKKQILLKYNFIGK